MCDVWFRESPIRLLSRVDAVASAKSIGTTLMQQMRRILPTRRCPTVDGIVVVKAPDFHRVQYVRITIMSFFARERAFS